MRTLPWLVVLLRHLVVSLIRAFGPEAAWREHCAVVRAHWEARP